MDLFRHPAAWDRACSKAVYVRRYASVCGESADDQG